MTIWEDFRIWKKKENKYRGRRISVVSGRGGKSFQAEVIRGFN